MSKRFVDTEKVPTFASAIERGCPRNWNSGALGQLVRIHACHAWGHGFESRTHRTELEVSEYKHLMVR